MIRRRWPTIAPNPKRPDWVNVKPEPGAETDPPKRRMCDVDGCERATFSAVRGFCPYHRPKGALWKAYLAEGDRHTEPLDPFGHCAFDLSRSGYVVASETCGGRAFDFWDCIGHDGLTRARLQREVPEDYRSAYIDSLPQMSIAEFNDYANRDHKDWSDHEPVMQRGPLMSRFRIQNGGLGC